MDEGNVEICQASNNSDVPKEENEEFTDEVESGSGTDVHQQKDGANDFESTRPISATVHNYFKANSSEEGTDYTRDQNDGESSRASVRFSGELLEERATTSGRHLKTSPLYDDSSLEDYQSIVNRFEALKTSPEDDPTAAMIDFPKWSSPTIGSYEKRLEDPEAEIRELLKMVPQNSSGENFAVDNSYRISDDELSNLSFPKIPSNDPGPPAVDDFVDHSAGSIDGESVSHASSHSLSKSYLYSSVSVGEDIPNFLQDDGDHLIPKFKHNGRGFCWPMDKLRLSGDRKFEEGAQWKICDNNTKPIGHGAFGQCFVGHPIDKENNLFCVKKCKYNEEEVKALSLAAKEIYAKKISEGAKKIVKFYGATYYKPDVCIFMEYMEGGTVLDAIQEAKINNKDGLDEIYCVNYSKDVLLALEFMHGKGLVHNDVKANNVLLTASKLEAKLCDFGKAAGISQENPLSRDVWAAGCFLLEMLGNKYSPALRSGILRKRTVVLNRLPDDVDPDTYQVLSMCFMENRDQCTATNVLKSEFFKKN